MLVVNHFKNSKERNADKFRFLNRGFQAEYFNESDNEFNMSEMKN